LSRRATREPRQGPGTRGRSRSSPSDLFDTGSWLRFTLTNAEMTRLIRQVPPELQTIFGSDVANPNVDSVSFEYRSVALTRPWFRPALFKARFWRLGAAGGELSDGGNPPQGDCPSYITALVFARNVTIQRRQQTGAPAEKLDKPGTLLTLAPNIQLHQLSLARATAMSPRMVSKVSSAAAQPAGVSQPRVAAATAASPVRTMRVMDTAATRGVSMQPQVALAGPQKALLLKSTTFQALKIPVQRPLPTPGPRPSPTPTPAPAPAPAPPPASPTDEVTILAFICKRLPRCPDPDPALTWG
jgi:hypothetical protein